ncbi:MAG TPA: restriction endonuclease [Thermoanaerobaculia bacterium]|nr:restriction endonuclease [Thermoanaerobaculia bacterium]
MTIEEQIDPLFVGRAAETRWLEQRLLSREFRQRPIFLTGVGGIGKTSLIRAFLASHPSQAIVRWLDLYQAPESAVTLEDFIRDLYAERPRGEVLVIVDGAEALTDQEISHATGRFFNLKAVRSVVFISRRTPPPGVDTLELGPLGAAETVSLLKAFTPANLTADILEEAALSTGGHPLAASLLAKLLPESPDRAAWDVIRGRLYDIERTIRVPPTGIVSAAGPRIVTAREALVEALRKRPESIYDLSPRKFEELIADLLTNMGWEVELTGVTRDGGKDMLAYLNTDLGRLLCLVEAKRYRRDRQVGVDLVRSLYGTLYDHQANSAMLVTTSSFSADARELQKKHQYHLSLRDYADIIGWLHRYKRAV